MLIYGSKARLLAKEILVEKCTSCGTMNSVELSLFQKYAHVFWIPFFPIGKTGVSQCQHCKQVLKLKEMPASMRVSFDNLKGQTKTPAWTFIGIALIAALIIVVIVSEKQKDARNAKLILSPQQGDIFEVKNGSNYTLYKVDHIDKDTVFVLISQFETNRISGLRGLKEKGKAAYTDIVQPFLKSELKDLFDKGKIIDIDRE
jgi:hypothetical protein